MISLTFHFYFPGKWLVYISILSISGQFISGAYIYSGGVNFKSKYLYKKSRPFRVFSYETIWWKNRRLQSCDTLPYTKTIDLDFWMFFQMFKETSVHQHIHNFIAHFLWMKHNKNSCSRLLLRLKYFRLNIYTFIVNTHKKLCVGTYLMWRLLRESILDRVAHQYLLTAQAVLWDVSWSWFSGEVSINWPRRGQRVRAFSRKPVHFPLQFTSLSMAPC